MTVQCLATTLDVYPGSYMVEQGNPGYITFEGIGLAMFPRTLC